MDANQFADNFVDGSPITLAPGASTTIAVSFTPSSEGPKNAALEIAHLGVNAPLVIPLGGTGVTTPAAPMHRVNAGGPTVSSTPNWSGDTVAAPSPFVNAAATTNQTFSTITAINVSHPSIPAGTPASVFQSERFDPPGGAELQWSFPVTPGRYEVRLYFAEIWFTTAGARTFNVAIEGNQVLSQYDIVADVGAFTGVMKSFTVSADASLDILFSHFIENPKISAIEILEAPAQSSQLGVAPAAVSFASTPVGQTSVQSLQLTNLGQSGDPNIVVTSTTISGTHANQFTDNFNDATDVTLAPGQSTTITVTFAPNATGAKTASLGIVHSGTNSPVTVALSGTGGSTSVGTWMTLAPSGLARHEVAYVQYNGKFYLTGDRGNVINEVYDAATNSWATAAPLPGEAHHAQAVELNGLIYYLGGLVGPFPDHVTPAVRVFNPTAGTWSTETAMPAARARGGGGTAAFNGMLYVAGGLQDDASGTGHDGVSVSLFDVYDPVAKTWAPLPNMPRARDHFQAAVVGNKFYVIGGRKGGDPGFFNAVIAPIDVYDFTTGTWSTLPATSNFPTPRAASAAAVIGSEIIVIGGEGNGNAYNNVEAFDTTTGTWRTLAPMPTARHGIQAAVCNGGIYIAGGALTQGGGSLTNIHQAFFLGAPTACNGGPTDPPSTVRYRVNAGGSTVSSTPNWSGDTTSRTVALRQCGGDD